jgi:hypothetical protein
MRTWPTTTDKTIIIPGHGQPVSNKSELREFRDMLVATRDNVAKLKRQGRSRDETVAAKPTAAFDAKWGNFVIDPGFFHPAGLRGRLTCGAIAHDCGQTPQPGPPR